VAQMAEKLGAALGRTVKVRYDRTPSAADTPADVAARDRAERQQSAERALGADPFVQALIRDFDARVIPESIRPAAAAKNPEK